MTKYRPRDVIDVSVWSAVVVIIAVPVVVAPDDDVRTGNLRSATVSSATSLHTVTIVVNLDCAYSYTK